MVAKIRESLSIAVLAVKGTSADDDDEVTEMDEYGDTGHKGIWMIMKRMMRDGKKGKKLSMMDKQTEGEHETHLEGARGKLPRQRTSAWKGAWRK